MSSFLDGLISRYNDDFGWDPPVPATNTDAVKHDRFDQAAWEEVKENVPTIGIEITDLSRKHDYVEDLARDTFNLLAKGDPDVRSRDEMAPSHEPNQAMIDEFAKMPEMQALRSLTANDQYAAAMGFLSIKDKIKEAAERMKKAREEAEAKKEAQEAAREAREAAQQALADAQAAQEAVDPNASPEEQQAGQAAADAAAQAAGAALGAAQDAQQAAQQAAQNAADASQEAVAGMRAEMRQAANAAAEEAGEEAELMTAFGVSDGELKKMPFDERKKLSERLRNNRLAKFVKLLGQFKQLQQAESRRRVKHVADEVVDVELGDDLTRLTTQELTNLATDEMEDDFWMRYLNRQLLVKRLEGTERLGQGPIIMVVDESGSMDTELRTVGGTREAWSKALSLAMCDHARKFNRDFHYIGFSSKGQQWHLSFPAGKAPLEKVIEMTEHFWGGGTEYEKPLTMALEIVEKDYEANGHPKPDIVFVSDDEYGSLSEEFMRRWLKAKDKLSLRAFGIAMDTKGEGAMAAICNEVTKVTDMAADPRAAGHLFRNI